MIGALWARFALWGAGALALLAAVGTALGLAKQAGVREAQGTEAKEEVKRDAKGASAVAEVAGKSDSAVLDELHRDFDRR